MNSSPLKPKPLKKTPHRENLWNGGFDGDWSYSIW